MSYLERLKADISGNTPTLGTDKADKSPFVSFVSAQGRHISRNELFIFAPPGDPANDDEALQERAAIMAEANGWNDATALKEARWQADRERCWRTFLRNAARVLAAPEAEREGLLAQYRAEADRRYGERTALDMAQSLASWVRGRGVH